MDNNLQNTLQTLKNAYLKKIDALIIEFKGSLESKAQINVNDLYIQIHKLSGTSGMYGLKDISDISTDFEFYLKEIKDFDDIDNEYELRGKFAEFIKNIENISIEGV